MALSWRMSSNRRILSAFSLGKKPKNAKELRSKPETESAFTAAQQPGIPTMRIPASTAALISSFPGSEIQGVPASVITATFFPSCICCTNQFAFPCSLNLWLETRRLRISSLFSRTMERRVSSAAIRSASSRIFLPLGERSAEFPIGVATI